MQEGIWRSTSTSGNKPNALVFELRLEIAPNARRHLALYQHIGE
jgi:hypothetical protein